MRRVRLGEAVFRYDEGDPDGFRSGMFRLGAELGAKQTGATLYELPPGQSICPYHYEYGEEEWILAVEGRPTVRTPEATEQIEPFDMVFFATGPEGAHEVRNDTDGTVRVLMWSNVVHPTATAYPDSDKVGIYTGDASEDGLFVRSAKVDYFHGEDRSP
jgi:uncharacterized cupin superfamily protein